MRIFAVPPRFSLYFCPLRAETVRCLPPSRLRERPWEGFRSTVGRDVIGAARALDRTLEGVGGLHRLADVVEANWHPPITVRPEPQSRRPEWKAEALRLLQYPQFLIREYPDEIDFLTNVSKMRSCPSEGQWRWLSDIANAVTNRIPPEMRKRKRRAA